MIAQFEQQKKRAEHGFGLYSLNKIAKKYNGEMSIVSEDQKFTIMLDMYFLQGY